MFPQRPHERLQIEQHQRQSPRRCSADPDVVRFDVTVGDPLLPQPVGDDEQLFAKALQEVEGESAFQAEVLGQRIGPGLDIDASYCHEQGGVTADVGLLIEFDDVGMAQRAEHLAFFDQACVQTGLQSDFEHPFLSIAFDQQGYTGRAFAQALLDGEASRETVIDAGVDRIDEGFRRWYGELIFNAFKQIIERDSCRSMLCGGELWR
jgi:hypothetical protein